MLYIAHRINSIDSLHKVPLKYGIEIDIRSENGEIVLGHDPDMQGVQLDEFLDHYRHQTIIANIKTEKIESRVIEIFKKNKVCDYFFLDSSMSTIFQLSTIANKKFCTRLSEFESIQTTILSQNLIKWVWVDCFTKLSLTKDEFEILKNKLNVKICLTSPDLLGRLNDIEPYADMLIHSKIAPDAICCKLENITKWTKFFPH